MPQKPWEKYQQTPGPWNKYAPKAEASPTLLESRRAASKSEFEANQPESTLVTRGRETAIGLLSPFDLRNVPDIVRGARSLLKAGLTGDVRAVAGAGKEILAAPVRPVTEFAQAIREGDPDAAARAAGAVVSETLPAVYGAVQGARSGIQRARYASPETGRELYRSALKPSTTIKPERVAEMVETGLKHELPISKEGLDKLDDLIDTFNDAVDARIAGSTRTVQPSAVAQRLRSTEQQFAQQVDPAADLAALESVERRFLGRHQTPGRPALPAQPTGLYDASGNPIMSPGTPAVAPRDIPIPAPEAQDLKKGTYRQLKAKSYGELKGAEIEAQKALARGLKEELDGLFPEIRALNAQEGRALDFRPVLERAVNRAANANKGRIGPMLAAGTAKVITGSGMFGAAVGVLKAVLDDPELASKLAIAITKAQRRNPQQFGPLSMKAAVARVAAVRSGLEGVRTSADSSGRE